MDTVLEDFLAQAARIVWCSAATVDAEGRPRSRVLHPVWEPTDDGGLVGWVLTNPTPIKQAHLAVHPYVSCSYWDIEHHTAVAECHAAWFDDVEHAWARVLAAAPPMGYDPAALGLWEAPSDPGSAALRLDPWSVSVRTLPEMAAGRRPRNWRP